ncbi:lipopolysaccharide biosynthesis protein [Priestia megaterium]|uniref:lipopolysaccharide biosynthesis protein n=1 Tax=Priestia megaterium TaxID=1404 RepID=UPI002E209C68|nr:oligosaccharide flippase family protein [Priestia megaterium]MED3939486.1 oligosaccharide flippase family protein [Priestia megaterium]
MKGNQLKIGAILSYLSLILGTVTSIAYTPVMLRLLGQSEYGLYSLANSVIGYLGVLNFGFGIAITRYTAKYKAMNDKEGEYNLNGMFIIVYSIIAFIIVIAGSVLVLNVGNIFDKSLTVFELKTIKILMALMIFNMAISFLFGIFGSIIAAYEKFILLKTVGLIQTIINPFIMLPLLLMGYKSVSLTLSSTVVSIVCITINVFYCFKILKVKIKFNKMDFRLLKEITGYSFFIFLNILVDKIYWSTDQVILGIVSGTTMVAVYSVGSTFNTYYMSFSTAITSVFLPRITQMVTNNVSNKEISDLFIKTGRIQYIIISFLLGGFILVGRNFISLWAGEQYDSAYFIALIIMIPLTVPLIQTLGITILQAKNMHKFRSNVYIAIAILNLLISIPFAQMFGGIGCAIGTSISMVIGNIVIMNIYYYKKINIDIPLFWKNVASLSLPILISLILGIFINTYLVEPTIVTLLIKGLIYIIIFTALMWFKGMNKFEKSLLLGPINNIISKLQKKERSVGL